MLNEPLPPFLLRLSRVKQITRAQHCMRLMVLGQSQDAFDHGQSLASQRSLLVLLKRTKSLPEVPIGRMH